VESVIQSLPLPVFIGMLAFAVAMAAVAIVAGVHARRQWRITTSTPMAHATTAEPGYRQFEGHVEAIDGQVLTAPLTGWSCVWYHARVEELRRHPRREHGPTWHTVSEVTSEVPFLLRDISGRVMVQPYGADLTPTDKSLWYGPELQPRHSNPAKYKPTENPPLVESITPSTEKYRYFEERIYNGDPLLVSGTFARFGAIEDDDDDDDADEPVADTSPDSDEMLAYRRGVRGRELSSGVITRGARHQPFIVTTTPRTQHVELLERGSLGAFGVALVPLALAAVLLAIRCG
jgi:hypothetical protein